jgi:hypothetical protein
MSVEMEAGESAEGLSIADRIDVTNSPSLERQTTFDSELARLHDQPRDDAATLLHLISAEATGPEDLRYNVLARDLDTGESSRRAVPPPAFSGRAALRSSGGAPFTLSGGERSGWAW